MKKIICRSLSEKHPEVVNSSNVQEASSVWIFGPDRSMDKGFPGADNYRHAQQLCLRYHRPYGQQSNSGLTAGGCGRNALFLRLVLH